MRCEREGHCPDLATRTCIRTDHAYDPGDPRADVPFEIVRTCDRHPIGDGQDGTADCGWRCAPHEPLGPLASEQHDRPATP